MRLIAKRILLALLLASTASIVLANKRSWQTNEISLEHQDERIINIIAPILKLTQKKVEGLERLGDKRVKHVKMKRVTAEKALKILLGCEGFRYSESENVIRIYSDESIDRSLCVTGMF